MASLLTFPSVLTTNRRNTGCSHDKITVCVNASWRSEGVIGLLMALQGVKDLSILDGACFSCRMASKRNTNEYNRLKMPQEL